MKKLILILLLLSSVVVSFGQFPEEHIKQLTKLNCELSDTWVVELDIEDDLNYRLPYPNISIGLWNYKTADDHGGNIGLSVYLFDKEYKDKVSSYDWGEDDETGYKLIETKSYIVVLDFYVPDGSRFGNMIPILTTELAMFFETRKDEL